jgi:hypothetical protein
MKELTLSRTKLTSIEGLAPQHNLSVFIADDSALESFINFSALSNASVYSLRNTPLSEKRLFRIGLALLSNSQRPVINGVLISEAEQKKVSAYPRFTGELVNRGWELVWPCPDSEHMKAVCRRYKVTYTCDIRDQSGAHASVIARPMEVNDAATALLMQFEGIIARRKENDAKVDQVSNTEKAFRSELKKLLSSGTRWVFTDHHDLDSQLLAAVTSLCLNRSRT